MLFALHLALVGMLYMLLDVLNAPPLIILNSLAVLAIGIARCACATAAADPRARAQAQRDIDACAGRETEGPSG